MVKKKKTLIFTSIVILLFGALMVYALNHNPNFTPSTLVGYQMPAFKAQTTDGNEFDSQTAFNNKQWVIVNFWSSSCYVCRNEAPELQDFYQTEVLGNKGDLGDKNNSSKPYFVSINIEDDSAAIANWKKNFSLTFPVIQDTKGAISVSFGVTGTPETFFVNPDGIVRYRLAGEVNKVTILNMISWLGSHPDASESEVTKQLALLRMGGAS